MSGPTTLADRLSRAFTAPAGGVLGLVDELLAASRGQEIRLGWQVGQCRVGVPGAEPPDQFDVAVPRAVVRAVLARVAALCNERVPNSVSPYQGVGEIAVDAATVVRVRFVNTPDEQTLELSPAGPSNSPPSGGPRVPAVSGTSEPLRYGR